MLCYVTSVDIIGIPCIMTVKRYRRNWAA